MKNPIQFIERKTGKVQQEQIYKGFALRFLYRTSIGRWIAFLIASNPFFSYLYGWWQSCFFTKKKVIRFVKKFSLNPSEFEKPLNAYTSFNAFFIRKLKAESRPLGRNIILPADGRYLFYQNIEKTTGIFVKGKTFTLLHLLKDNALVQRYQTGSMVIARLCPTDYHRFHFPCECIPDQARLVKGKLYSVNPLALREKIEWLTENKRMITKLKTAKYGDILFIEIGATFVGSIHQTYAPMRIYQKGEEKGYFSFGGSCIILLFEPGCVYIDPILLDHSSRCIETRCFFGESLEGL